MQYWHIGREIAEHVQSGKERAEYGKRVIEELADRLHRRYGRGFSITNLRYFRTFYQVYADRTPEIRQTASGESGPAPASEKIRHMPSGVLNEHYTVKRYESERTKDGDSWRHARITLKPANPDFQPIVLTGAEEGQVQVIAECVEVLGGGS